MASTSDQEDELWDRWSEVRPLDRESARHEPLGCASVAGEARWGSVAVPAAACPASACGGTRRSVARDHRGPVEPHDHGLNWSIGFDGVARNRPQWRQRMLSGNGDRHLRSGRSVRHARRVKQSHGFGALRNMVSIRQRPVAEGFEAGHWEEDMMMGKRPSVMATPAESGTCYSRTPGSANGQRGQPPVPRKRVGPEIVCPMTG